MREFLIAAAASLLLFGGQAQASPVEDLGEPNVEIQEQESKWAHFRDKHILGRETENERRDREDWERRYRDDYYRHRDRHRDDYYRDRERHRDDYRYYPSPPRHGAPPPPPPGRGYNYPPPPNR